MNARVSTTAGRRTAARNVADMPAKTERHDRITTGQRRLDDHIASTVAHTLEWNGLTPSNVITIQVSRGCVTLTGHVYSHHDREEAAMLAKHVPDVVAVDNRIEVLTEDVLSARLKGAIVDMLRRRAGYGGDAIGVEVRNGKVVLTGEVGSTLEKRLVIDTLQWNHHVHAIEDRLRVTRERE